MKIDVNPTFKSSFGGVTMKILASDLMDLPIEHFDVVRDGDDLCMMFETIDKDDEGVTARWRLVFSLSTGAVYSKSHSTMRTFSCWGV